MIDIEEPRGRYIIGVLVVLGLALASGIAVSLEFFGTGVFFGLLCVVATISGESAGASQHLVDCLEILERRREERGA